MIQARATAGQPATTADDDATEDKSLLSKRRVLLRPAPMTARAVVAATAR